MPIETRALELLRTLIRFDTTNPPGNERACLEHVAQLLTNAGVAVEWYALDENRPNLTARIPGRGRAPTILLYGHVDVVPAREPGWPHPPFEAHVEEGWVWGRGALDMKGGVAMMLSAFLELAAEETPPPGDVVLLLLSDEEGDGTFGARFLVREHPELFRGIRYAVGEFGGFSFHVEGRRFYPIMVAEKQICCLRLSIRGASGHGSMPVRNGAMAKLGRVLQRLDRLRLPVRFDGVSERFLRGMSDDLPVLQRLLLHALLQRPLTDPVLRLMGPRGALFEPMLRDTVAATMIDGDQSHNVIPGEVGLHLDARLLPGRQPADLVDELTPELGDDIAIEVTRFEEFPGDPDLGLFDLLADVLREADPAGKPLPFLLPGSTDGRFLRRLGIQTYGFLPMKLPADFNFSATIHSVGERIPVEALEFGTRSLSRLLHRLGEASAPPPDG